MIVYINQRQLQLLFKPAKYLEMHVFVKFLMFEHSSSIYFTRKILTCFPNPVRFIALSLTCPFAFSVVQIQLYRPLWLRRPSPQELAMQMAALCIQLDSLVTSPHQVDYLPTFPVLHRVVKGHPYLPE